MIKPFFDFFKYAKIFYLFSFLAVILSLYTIFFGKQFKYGTDFTGGVEVTAQFSKQTTTQDLFVFFKTQKLQVDIESILTKKNRFIFRIPISNQKTGLEIEALLKENLQNFSKNGNSFSFERSRVVGGVISRENRDNAIKIIVFAIIAIVFYITFRFKWQYSLAAIIAVFHDVFIMLGVISFSQFEVNVLTITSILTIFGYSVNDTIVLFDRVREKIRQKEAVNYKEVVNQSVNSIFIRTLITSLTTLVVVFTMYLFTQGSLKNFAFSLIIGLIIGTYSSIYVACGFMLFYHSKIKSQL